MRALPQMYARGMMPCGNASLVIVIGLGAVTVTPEEKSPQPASGTAQQTAATARAARRARPRRRPDLEPASHFTRLILGPAAGCGGRVSGTRCGR
jgi:hypothetical protein